MDAPSEAPKRSYDARKRQERAVVERQETRRKVVEAASRLFAERGYVATTINDIAREAGVALKSVYAAGRSKADLLHLVSDFVIAGDLAPIAITQRPWLLRIQAAPPSEQIELIAETISRIADQAMPIWIAERQAAAVDAGAAEVLKAQQTGRLETFRHIARSVQLEALHPGMTQDDAADAAWAIGAPEVSLLLRRTLGWSREKHQEWLQRTLRRALLAPTPGESAPGAPSATT